MQFVILSCFISLLSFGCVICCLRWILLRAWCSLLAVVKLVSFCCRHAFITVLSTCFGNGPSLLQSDTPVAFCSYQQYIVVETMVQSMHASMYTTEKPMAILDGITSLPKPHSCLFIIFAFVFCCCFFIVGNLLIPNWNCESAIYLGMYLLCGKVVWDKNRSSLGH